MTVGKENLFFSAIENSPREITWKIFSFLRHSNAQIIIDAFWGNQLSLKYVDRKQTNIKIWNELRPLALGSNVYGSGMCIIRNKINLAEKLRLFI